MSALADVLDALARAVDDDPPDEASLGEITLRPPQLTALRDIRKAISEFGGALLADAPGLGKTYTALAVARDHAACAVVAPAALRAMWRESSARAQVETAFVSLEAVSRGHAPAPAPLLIIDEAHRAANVGTARYRALALAAEGRRVLLLSATPVRNRRDELDALLALFLGERVTALDDDARTRVVIRRSATDAAGLPGVQAHRPIRVRGGRALAHGIQCLPDPLPLDDASPAGALVRNGLARYWSSSEAALERALARRVQRGLAIRDMLDAGQRPTRDEIRAWVVGDDATQLAFPLGSAGEGAALARWRIQLDAHVTAASALRELVARTMRRDAAWRGAQLRTITARHPDAIVIAFTCFEATAQAVFGAVRDLCGAVLLTGRGARSAAGPLDRDEVIARLQHARTPDRGRSTLELRLVIATDLLSEGVNLQGASVIVHLDQPWTPSAAAQRVGRAARLGSTHGTVHEYGFAAPRAAEGLLAMDRVHHRKRDAAREALAAAVTHQRIRQLFSQWRAMRPTRAPSPYAAATAATDGFLARVDSPSRSWIIGGESRRGRPLRVDAGPRTILRLASTIGIHATVTPSPSEMARATHAVMAWLARQRATTVSGIGLGQSPQRRRLLARFDALLRSSPASRRPVLAARIGRLRAILLEARGAAVEMHAHASLEHAPDAAGWLDDVERRLSGDISLRTPDHRQAEVSALLILRRTAPDPAGRSTSTASPAPRPCPPSVSTETAAPR